ncbi:fatty acid cis/trans isomerase [Pseudoalteromonas sp. L23]|uniref:fatty acid cis/trans isomerase n=1 Tax=unclassified Pseudoalteromonas TaxID=194690 RepID=UPI001EF09294|nr:MULTISPECIES: fatty acid cis/trans isomerase [unclassified Pseudoalteromonas]MCF7516285.1 fatty acid cis/trans isomerase [Pseudoalteromonas sp. L7]MCF7528372.1 fatty acid cis/trans isomerase [Pseudoalteromonas sp. L23]MCX2769138.1 fatty acid cis/trans isomerase [Pseudoalteromonas sp. B530]
MSKRALFCAVVVAVLSGCVALGVSKYDDMFGPEQPQARIEQYHQGGARYLQSVKPILESRCVVCHGCYDAPCQLKLSSPEGIDRGLSKELVYDGTRLLAQTPTRLLFDAQTTTQWRERGFTPVLNERNQSEYSNLAGSVLYNSLLLKMSHRFPEQGILGKEFDFSLDRTQSCPTMDEFSTLAKQQPHAGMPYGLPALTHDEFKTLEAWLQSGSKMSQIAKPSVAAQKEVKKWEQFFNQDSNKHRLAARYIFEHWYLAHIHFPHLDDPAFFQLVRSSTPPGQPIALVSSVRPFDDPEIDRVYYRLMQVRSTILSKTHMPLALNDAKLSRLHQQFYAADYHVEELPGYEPELAANPFKVFKDIPVNSRYQFMLDEAELIVKGFIKGPVCRGQIALNVINDHFWVAFVDPEKNSNEAVNQLLLKHDEDLVLPAAEQSNALPLSSWAKYATKQQDYLRAKTELADKMFADGQRLNMDLIWRGEGENPNAALTIFRHFDSATVVKGFIGQPPKTAWVLDYALFERIHYLLVAGFDVYGNIGHQLITRLYMDFLRLEGEQNFLNLLPLSHRQEIKRYWYRKSHLSLSEFINRKSLIGAPTGIKYETDDPKQELYDKLHAVLKPILNRDYDYQAVGKPLQALNSMSVRAINLLPQVSFIITKQSDGSHQAFSLLHHNAHYNISSLLNEEGQRAYTEDTATIVPGFIGDYPEAIWYLESEVAQEDFVSSFSQMNSESDYRALRAQYGIRRTHPEFWRYSDLIHDIAKQTRGVEYGLFDYNRLENR